MYSQLVPPKWVPQIEQTRGKLEEQRKKSQKDERTSILRPILKSHYEDEVAPANERNPFKRRYKRTQIAGIFAHAKSSDNYYRHDKDYGVESPEKGEDYEEDLDNYRNNLRVRREVIQGTHEPEFLLKEKPDIIRKRQDPIEENSEDEHEEPSNLPERKFRAPAVQKQNSDVETDYSKKWEAVKWFTDNLSRKEVLPSLPVNKKNGRSLDQLEIDFLGAELGEKIPDGGRKICVMDLIHDNAEWLMFAEEYNDKTDYEPHDPHFLNDQFTNRYDQYLASEARKSERQYSRDSDVNSDDEDEDRKPISAKNQKSLYFERPPERTELKAEKYNSEQIFFSSSPEKKHKTKRRKVLYENMSESERNPIRSNSVSENPITEGLPPYAEWKEMQRFKNQEKQPVRKNVNHMQFLPHNSQKRPKFLVGSQSKTRIEEISRRKNDLVESSTYSTDVVSHQSIHRSWQHFENVGTSSDSQFPSSPPPTTSASNRKYSFF